MHHLTRGALAVAPTLALLALLAGCETTPSTALTSNAPVETRGLGTGGAGAAGGATGAVSPQSKVATVDLARSGTAGAAGGSAATPAANTALLALNQRVVYFDFDSFAIKDEFNAMLDSHAKALAASKGAKRMAIEGHTDERGGREYNLALGQKRAEAVLRSLTLLGASGKQLEAVSFGEERPAAQGSDESAWSRNRRAELKDR
jgi:peptidoglycan-associated lipoprotein